MCNKAQQWREKPCSFSPRIKHLFHFQGLVSSNINWANNFFFKGCWKLCKAVYKQTQCMLYPKNAHLHSLWYLYEWTLFLCTKDAAAAAAKSLQSCPTLCDPMDTKVMQLLCFFIFLVYFKLFNLKKNTNWHRWARKI